MKVSRLSPRYEVELIELADAADALVDSAEKSGSQDVGTLKKELRSIAKTLRFMVDDNERFLNS
jgi:hypothetical protein